MQAAAGGRLPQAVPVATRPSSTVWKSKSGGSTSAGPAAQGPAVPAGERSTPAPQPGSHPQVAKPLPPAAAATPSGPGCRAGPAGAGGATGRTAALRSGCGRRSEFFHELHRGPAVAAGVVELEKEPRSIVTLRTQTRRPGAAARSMAGPSGWRIGSPSRPQFDRRRAAWPSIQAGTPLGSRPTRAVSRGWRPSTQARARPKPSDPAGRRTAIGREMR